MKYALAFENEHYGDFKFYDNGIVLSVVSFQGNSNAYGVIDNLVKERSKCHPYYTPIADVRRIAHDAIDNAMSTMEHKVASFALNKFSGWESIATIGQYMRPGSVKTLPLLTYCPSMIACDVNPIWIRGDMMICVVLSNGLLVFINPTRTAMFVVSQKRLLNASEWFVRYSDLASSHTSMSGLTLQEKVTEQYMVHVRDSLQFRIMKMITCECLSHGQRPPVVDFMMKAGKSFEPIWLLISCFIRSGDNTPARRKIDSQWYKEWNAKYGITAQEQIADGILNRW